jgi:hypothetical protein
VELAIEDLVVGEVIRTVAVLHGKVALGEGDAHDRCRRARNIAEKPRESGNVARHECGEVDVEQGVVEVEENCLDHAITPRLACFGLFP